MDATGFIKLIKSEIVKYYNYELPPGFRVQQITEKDVIIPGEGFVPDIERVRVSYDKAGKPMQWDARYICTSHVKIDHLWFSAVFIEKNVPRGSGSRPQSEFVLNVKLEMGLANQHTFYNDDWTIAEKWDGNTLFKNSPNQS